MTAVTPTEVQYLNIAYFGRPADPASLGAWPASGATAAEVVAQFAGTGEYNTNTIIPNSVATPGGSRTINETNLINTFYQRLFGRLAQSSEIAGWTTALAQGTVNSDYLGITILNAALNLPADTEMRQVLVAKFDSAQLWTGDLYNDNTAASAYSSAQAINDGISFLNTVTTSTAATTAVTEAAVDSMTQAGGLAGGNAFRQIANNAILTNNANTNNAGTAPGFSPSGNLSNANDTISVGVFSGATIQDATTTDADVLVLDAAGFANSLNIVAGVETIQMAGAASLSANQLAGVTTINYANAGSLNNFSAAASAAINVFNTGVNALSAAAGVNSAVSISFSAVANSGTFNLAAGSTAISLTFNSGINSYNFAQSAEAARQSLVVGGAGSAFTLNLSNTASYTAAGGSISAGGNILVNNTGFSAGIFGTTANIFSFSTAGTNTYQVNVSGQNIATAQNFAGVSGLDVINFATTAGGNGFSGIDLSANFNNGALTLGFGTGMSAGGGLTGLFVANDIRVSATSGSITATTNSLTLNFLSDSATSGLTFSAGAIQVSAVETINMNMYGSGGSFNIENAFSAAQATTLNVNSTANGFLSITAANVAGLTGFRTFGFSQADGGVTFLLGTGFNSAVNTSYSLVAGSGGDTINFRNIMTAGGDFASILSAKSQMNQIDISDGGNDVIRLGFGTGLAQASSFLTAASAGNLFRANIIGFGVGDILSFTQNNTAGLTVATLTGNSLSQAGAGVGTTGLIGLFYDGTDTLVFFCGTALVSAVAGYSAVALNAVLEGGDFSNAARWSLNAQGALQLTA